MARSGLPSRHLPRLEVIRPVLELHPFDDPDWVFEIKHDGFRAVAYLEAGRCELVSRNGHTFTRFARLSRWLEKHLQVETAILDGEIVCLDSNGKSMFAELMTGKSETYFYAFDLLWHDGKDLRELGLLERKARLKTLIPHGGSFLLFVDHLSERGRDVYHQVCTMDLEGLVAKRADGAYQSSSRWVKVKNPNYSQLEGRGELFKKPSS